MKKFIICAVIILASAITAWSFNKKDNTANERIETIEKANFADQSANRPISDISTAD